VRRISRWFAPTAAPPPARGTAVRGLQRGGAGRRRAPGLKPERPGSAFLWGTMLHTIGLRSIGAPRTKTSASSRRIRARTNICSPPSSTGGKNPSRIPIRSENRSGSSASRLVARRSKFREMKIPRQCRSCEGYYVRCGGERGWSRGELPLVL